MIRRQLFQVFTLTALFTAASASSLHAMRTCNPRTFGAKGDGSTKDTKAIQAAIDACAQHGGGVVVLSAEMYVAAPIDLKSNIILQLDKGATLRGSPDHQDYPPHDEFRLPESAAAGERDPRNQCGDHRRRCNRWKWRELVAGGAEYQGSWDSGNPGTLGRSSLSSIIARMFASKESRCKTRRCGRWCRTTRMTW